MNKLPIIAIAILSFQAKAQLFQIGAKYPVNDSMSLGQLLTSGGGFEEGYEILDHGSRFLLGLDSLQTITFIFTEDTSFKTPEGLHVGGKIVVRYRNKQMCEPGWATYVRTDSGWNAIISYGKCVQRSMPVRSYTIKAFFQRSK